MKLSSSKPNATNPKTNKSAAGTQSEQESSSSPPPARYETPTPRNSPGAPAFPRIEAGEWIEVMHQTEPHVEITLPMGAFVWLWDVVELRLAKWEEGTRRSMGPEFVEVYEQAVYGALEEIRRAASRHYRIVEAPRSAKASVTETAEKGRPVKPAPKTPSKPAAKKIRFRTS